MAVIRGLSDVIQQLFGVRTSPRMSAVGYTVGITAVQILANNPKRIGVIIINNSLNSLYVATDPNVASTRGIYVAPGGGNLILNWEQDFELVTNAWFGIAGAAASSVTILENLITGKSE